MKKNEKKMWNSDTYNFLSKILAYISLKSAILSSAMIMTSLWRHTWDVGTYFGMYGKRRPLAIYTMVPVTCVMGFHFQVHKGW